MLLLARVVDAVPLGIPLATRESRPWTARSKHAWLQRHAWISQHNSDEAGESRTARFDRHSGRILQPPPIIEYLARAANDRYASLTASSALVARMAADVAVGGGGGNATLALALVRVHELQAAALPTFGRALRSWSASPVLYPPAMTNLRSYAQELQLVDADADDDVSLLAQSARARVATRCLAHVAGSRVFARARSAHDALTRALAVCRLRAANVDDGARAVWRDLSAAHPLRSRRDERMPGPTRRGPRQVVSAAPPARKSAPRRRCYEPTRRHRRAREGGSGRCTSRGRPRCARGAVRWRQGACVYRP